VEQVGKDTARASAPSARIIKRDLRATIVMLDQSRRRV
jgi:hypothetical protein